MTGSPARSHDQVVRRDERHCGCTWTIYRDGEALWAHYTQRCPAHAPVARSIEPWELALFDKDTP